MNTPTRLGFSSPAKMLAAQKGALERQLHVQMLDLQWKELDYLHTNFQNLATSSALLLGFGFTALGLSTSYHPEAAEGATVTETELLAFAKARLPGFMAPKTVVFGPLPKTSTGKIQKFVLRERAKGLGAVD